MKNSPRPISEKPKCIIVDIDGTIADVSHRTPAITGVIKNWEKFNDLMHLDPPKTIIIDMVKAIEATGVNIILVTGRFERYRIQTEAWLVAHSVPFGFLLMRKDGDYRSDCVIKKEIYHKLIKPEFEVNAAFEDRDSVVAMWREEGLICLQVLKGDY